MRSAGSPKTLNPPAAGIDPKSITSGVSWVYSNRTLAASLRLRVATASPRLIVTTSVTLSRTVTVSRAAAGAAVRSW